MIDTSPAGVNERIQVMMTERIDHSGQVRSIDKDHRRTISGTELTGMFH